MNRAKYSHREARMQLKYAENSSMPEEQDHQNAQSFNARVTQLSETSGLSSIESETNNDPKIEAQSNDIASSKGSSKRHNKLDLSIVMPVPTSIWSKRLSQ